MIFDESFWRSTEKRYAANAKERKAVQKAIEKKEPPLKLDSPARIRARFERLGYADLAKRAAGRQLRAADVARELAAADEIQRLALERVLGTNDLTPIGFLERGTMIARSIGRIRIRDLNRRLVGWGTGFLVSPRLLLTNNHVLENLDQARFSEVEFNYQEGPFGRMTPSHIFGLEPHRFFETHVALDYTLVAVADRSSDNQPLAAFGWNRLIAESGKALMGEFVNIIQHPNGEPKQLALRENQVVGVVEDFIHYETDTAPGSSGSPVFNDQWEVMALHHAGVPRRDPNGRVLTRDGKLWRPGLEPDWIANEGIRISRILADLTGRRLDATRSRLREEMFELSPPFLLEANAPATPSGAATPRTTAGPTSRALGDGSIEVTFPVTLRLASGDVTLPARPGSGTHPGTPGEPPPVTPPTPGERPVPPDYYVAEADAEARETYYEDINMRAGRKALFESLSELVQQTHGKQVRYREARLEHLYPRVDLHPDSLLRSVYSGAAFDPQEVLQHELALEAILDERIAELMRRESGLSEEALALEIDQLEASLPFNCEHVVPQSWFGEREPMKGDLHHLFTCESNCNSFRSNIPYFDFTDFEEVIREDCGKRESEGFEPSASKGAVARATFYFLLRYPGQVAQQEEMLTKERIETLLAWHEAEPPDRTLHELHRNAEIFAVQGNRNPFIDHPKLAAKVDFTLGLG